MLLRAGTEVPPWLSCGQYKGLLSAGGVLVSRLSRCSRLKQNPEASFITSLIPSGSRTLILLRISASASRISPGAPDAPSSVLQPFISHHVLLSDCQKKLVSFAYISKIILSKSVIHSLIRYSEYGNELAATKMEVVMVTIGGLY